MAKARKVNKGKNVKQRNILLVIFIAFLRILLWFSKKTYRFSSKNPLYALGVFIFFISFGFVSFNALFAQTARHQGVFIQTRPNVEKTQEDIKPTNTKNRTSGVKNVSIPAVEAQKTTATNIQEPAPIPKPQNSFLQKSTPEIPIPQMKPNLRNMPNIREGSVLDMQKKLADLGLYHGPLDGLNGPKMKKALESYEKLNVISKPSPKPVIQVVQKDSAINDSIASLVISDKQRAEPTIDRVYTNSISDKNLQNLKNIQIEKTSPPTLISKGNTQNSIDIKKSVENAKESQNVKNLVSNDIAKVQKALIVFGNNTLEVTGKQDEKTTRALRAFQQMFSLNVTGQVSAEVLSKMREIGLIS